MLSDMVSQSSLRIRWPIKIIKGDFTTIFVVTISSPIVGNIEAEEEETM